MTRATERNRNIVSGAIGILVLVALAAVGIKASFGAYDSGYELRGTFVAAGQGLLAGSDVKIRGVDVGEVERIRLAGQRAEIIVRIGDGTRIPRTAQAVVRPKTLFGEKFIDIVPGDDELTGPYLGDGDEIADTLGGFELEQVLTDAYPVLAAIDPVELTTVLGELADAGDGLGDRIGSAIENGATLAELAVSNDAEFRALTRDLATLGEELDVLAPAAVAGARDLAVALPTITDRRTELSRALGATSRLSSDLAELLRANESFTRRLFDEGSAALDVVHDRRSQLQPLLLGVTQYARTFAEAIRFDLRDGSAMAAIKNVVSVQAALEGAAPPAGEADDGAGSVLDAVPLPAVPAPVPEIGGIVDDLLGVTDPLLDLLVGGGD